MPAESKTAAATPPKSKPVTKSSIRQSLNLASMSKALVDVISKDKDSSKQAKKSKEAASRRSSILNSQPPPPPAAPRASMGDVRPSSQVGKRTSTPESRTITRRRVSASYARSSSDEQQQPRSSTQDPGTPQSVVQMKSTTTRPKNVVPSSSSALPKYRPKSTINDLPAPKPPSPVKAGTRRRLSSSEDEKKDQNVVISPADKSSRPISPLPHRAALKNLNSLNVTPPPTPSKTKSILPSSPPRLSPSRPTKIVKTNASSAIPRPPSSNSSASLHLQATPKSLKVGTPKNSETKGKFPSSHPSVHKSGGTPSRMVPSPYRRDSPSPLFRQSRQSSKTTPNSSMMSSNMSQISEASSESEDSDLENVELLLAPVASMTAPTPAMPRIQLLKKRGNPQTPTRSRLPTREDLSYVSPEPPGSDNKNSSLRPQVRPPNSEAARGSILSWEQLAADASRTMAEDEFGRMLADIPAPFRSGAASPSLSSQLGLPDSPCLSVIDSPGGGYGSISQVLLPDVTPSPAVNHNIHQHKFHLATDASKSVVDSSTVTLLRLQLAAMENTAKERLVQMQAMEEEIHNVKQAHAHQMEEMQKQFRFIESQSRANDDRTSQMFKASLHERLHQQEGAFQQAMLKFEENAKVSHRHALNIERTNLATAFSATIAASTWSEVVSVCDVELDHVRSDRAMLAFLLTQLDQMSGALK